MSSTESFRALILAGGKSNCLDLQLNGQSLLAYMQQLALESDASEVLISRNQPCFINDQFPEQGPLVGLLATLQHCNSSQLLVLPIDIYAIPFIR